MYKNAKRFTAILLLVFLLIVSINFAVIAQDSSEGPTVNFASRQICSVPPSLKTQQVIADNGRNQVKMGDRIRVRVEGLSAATKSTTANATNLFDPRQLVLYLDGYELEDVHGEPVLVMVPGKDQQRIVDDNWLAFRLERTDSSQAAWNALLGRANRYSINVIAGVGCPNKLAIPVSDPLSPPELKIVLFSWRFWLCLFLLVAIVLIFIRYCRNTLRSPGIEGVYSQKEVIGGQELLLTEKASLVKENRKSRIAQFFLGRKKLNRNPFSLSISQLAFWTFLIFGAYLIIYGITGDYTNILTEQSLILLGINSITAFGTSLIDGQGNEKKRKGSQRISEGFFYDILSDINGVNFHRFQTFIWTVAIGLFFVWEVIKNLAMPEFDETLLTLQGISAATFLGLRGQEQHAMTKSLESTSQEDSASEQPLPTEEDNPQEEPLIK
jgi:ABC-type Fe3+-siderophore transport system permease subunit